MTFCMASIEHRPEALDGESQALATFEQEIQGMAREFAEQVEDYLAKVTGRTGRPKCSVTVQHLSAGQPAPSRRTGLDLAVAIAEYWARIVVAPAPADERQTLLRRALGRGLLGGPCLLGRSLAFRRICPALLPFARPPPVATTRIAVPIGFRTGGVGCWRC
jgi:hypothetical protein